MDDSRLLSADPFEGGFASVMLHFADKLTATRNAKVAIERRDPFLFGTTLHQVQDWYSHWNEGYRDETGHLGPSAKARRRKANGQLWSFYWYNHRSEIKAFLSQRYSSTQINSISDNRLIDLYSQELGINGKALAYNTDFGIVEVNLRDYYGYEPDIYFEFTHRDIRMREQTSEVLGDFFRNFNFEPCNMERFWIRYTQLNDQQIKDFLEKGE